MEKIDLSANSKQIQQVYDKIVRGDKSTSYAVFSVDKGSIVSVSETGNGPLEEFLENFTDGQVQYGLARVIVPGSDVSKNLLLGWCPDNAPSKSRLSFATNFADVSRVLSGYHVQITARDQDDLDADDFVQRVSAAAGASYSLHSGSTGGSSAFSKKPAPAKPVQNKPYTAPKPSYVPKSTGKPVFGAPPKPTALETPIKPSAAKSKQLDDDEWGGESEIEERDFEKKPLEDVPSAYKPTKVDIESLRKQKSDTISSTPTPSNIKVEAKEEEESEESKSLKDRMKTFTSSNTSSDGRLTSLPKPKVNNSVASRFSPASTSSAPSFGSKPAIGNNFDDQFKKDKLVGGASRNFASEGGKTPAQIWAEKRGQYKTVPQDSTTASQQEELTPKIEKLSVNDKKPLSNNTDLSDEESQGGNGFGQAAATESIKKESSPAPAPPILPVRNLPPPPVRNVALTNPTPPVEPAKNENTESSVNETPSPKLPERTVTTSSETPAPPSLPNREPAATETVTAIAEYDYEKDEDNEIGFQEGDLIVEIDFVDDEWWSGKHSVTGEVGLFPSSYVSVKNGGGDVPKENNSTPQPVEDSKNTVSAIAEYDYEKDEDNEIGFSEGDLIVDIEFLDEDWWSGKHEATGEVGLFPANYVRLNS